MYASSDGKLHHPPDMTQITLQQYFLLVASFETTPYDLLDHVLLLGRLVWECQPVLVHERLTWVSLVSIQDFSVMDVVYHLSLLDVHFHAGFLSLHLHLPMTSE